MASKGLWLCNENVLALRSGSTPTSRRKNCRVAAPSIRSVKKCFAGWWMAERSRLEVILACSKWPGRWRTWKGTNEFSRTILNRRWIIEKSACEKRLRSSIKFDIIKMSRFLKLIARLRQSPKNIHWYEFWAVINYMRFQKIKSSGGSHCKWRHPTKGIVFVAPRSNPVRPVYVQQLLKIIEKDFSL